MFKVIFIGLQLSYTKLHFSNLYLLLLLNHLALSELLINTLSELLVLLLHLLELNFSISLFLGGAAQLSLQYFPFARKHLFLNCKFVLQILELFFS